MPYSNLPSKGVEPLQIGNVNAGKLIGGGLAGAIKFGGKLLNHIQFNRAAEFKGNPVPNKTIANPRYGQERKPGQPKERARLVNPQRAAWETQRDKINKTGKWMGQPLENLDHMREQRLEFERTHPDVQMPHFPMERPANLPSGMRWEGHDLSQLKKQGKWQVNGYSVDPDRGGRAPRAAAKPVAKPAATPAAKPNKPTRNKKNDTVLRTAGMNPGDQYLD